MGHHVQTRQSLDNNVSVEIDLSSRTLRADGPREFVEEQIKRFKDLLKGHPDIQRRRGRPRLRPRPQDLPPLELEGTGETPPLRDWIDGVQTKSNYQRCALFIYYLNRELGREPIIHEDVCRCFRHLDIKPPSNVQVCLSEAKRKYGFVEMPGNGTVLLTRKGEAFVKSQFE